MSNFQADALVFGRGDGVPCAFRPVSAKRANILIAAARNRGCWETCNIRKNGPRPHINYSFYDSETDYCWLSLSVYFPL